MLKLAESLPVTLNEVGVKLIGVLDSFDNENVLIIGVEFPVLQELPKSVLSLSAGIESPLGIRLLFPIILSLVKFSPPNTRKFASS